MEHEEKTLVDINNCNEEDLQRIIHIGPFRAKRIHDNRPFGDLYELSNVVGLGKQRMNDIFAQGLATTHAKQ